MCDRTLLRLVLVLAVLSLATNCMVLNQVRTRSATDSSSTSGPPSNVEIAYFSMSLEQGFNFDPDVKPVLEKYRYEVYEQPEHFSFGHVETFSLNGELLSPDLNVTDPDDPEGDRKFVFCVLSEYCWELYANKPIIMLCHISAENAAKVRDIVSRGVSGPEVEMSFTIYEYSRFGEYHPAHRARGLKAPISMTSYGQQVLHIQGPSRMSVVPETNTMYFSVDPLPYEKQTIELKWSPLAEHKSEAGFGGCLGDGWVEWSGTVHSSRDSTDHGDGPRSYCKR